jgi:hypothetical protein
MRRDPRTETAAREEGRRSRSGARGGRGLGGGEIVVEPRAMTAESGGSQKLR